MYVDYVGYVALLNVYNQKNNKSVEIINLNKNLKIYEYYKIPIIGVSPTPKATGF